ncbi:MAG TPA: phosphate/phosphite/phosphonate ABC transporter substrate-binding protein [Chthonomonadaceae bacterium]|nr:phosphate/phosphite/phosphonate ABC transporter substrate-binding protein [Chthonomonadaceae bacterium]
MQEPILVGAVAYDPSVVVIWDIIKTFFETSGCPMDTVFYTNYERQVKALLSGHIDIAWNSPLAWLDAQRHSGGTCRAIAMRDTDRDRVSHIVVRADSGFEEVTDLAGKTIATGAKDSPQATLLPLGLLQRHGLEPGRDVRVQRFDVLVGKHGDHIGGERQALEALQTGQVDGCAMLDLNWQRWSADGTIDPDRYRVLATTDLYDHCVFTVREDFPQETEAAWLQTLFSMRYDDPAHRQMMEMEALKAWLPGRTSGFDALSEAVERQHFFEPSAS